MAYENYLSDTAPIEFDYRGDCLEQELDGPVVRPYLTDTVFLPHEEEFDLTKPAQPYDPLTAPLSEVIAQEWVTEQAYNESSTLWGEQAEQAHQTAFARSTVLRSLRRVADYRAQRPAETWTEFAAPEVSTVSSVDVALAELRDLRTEIDDYLKNPPHFNYEPTQPLQTKQHDHPTLNLRLPETFTPIDPAPATLREPTRSSEAPATQPAESKLVGESKEGQVRARFQKLKALSTNGARRFISRITRQAVLFG